MGLGDRATVIKDWLKGKKYLPPQHAPPIVRATKKGLTKEQAKAQRDANYAAALAKHGIQPLAQPCWKYSITTHPTTDDTILTVGMRSFIYSLAAAKKGEGFTDGEKMLSVCAARLRAMGGPNLRVVMLTADDPLSMTPTRSIVEKKRKEQREKAKKAREAKKQAKKEEEGEEGGEEAEGEAEEAEIDPATISVTREAMSHTSDQLLTVRQGVIAMVQFLMENLASKACEKYWGKVAVMSKIPRTKECSYYHGEEIEAGHYMFNFEFIKKYNEFYSEVGFNLPVDPTVPEQRKVKSSEGKFCEIFRALDYDGEDDFQTIACYRAFQTVYSDHPEYSTYKCIIYCVDYDVMMLCMMHNIDAYMIWTKTSADKLDADVRADLDAQVQAEVARLSSAAATPLDAKMATDAFEDAGVEGRVMQYIDVGLLNKQLRGEANMDDSMICSMIFLIATVGTDYNDAFIASKTAVMNYTLYEYVKRCKDGQGQCIIKVNDSSATLVSGVFFQILAEMREKKFIKEKDVPLTVGAIESSVLKVFHYVLYLLKLKYSAYDAHPHEFGFNVTDEMYIAESCMIKQLCDTGAILPCKPGKYFAVLSAECRLGRPLDSITMQKSCVMWTAKDCGADDMETDYESDASTQDGSEEYAKRKKGSDSDEDYVLPQKKRMRPIEKKKKRILDDGIEIHYERSGVFPCMVYADLEYTFSHEESTALHSSL